MKTNHPMDYIVECLIKNELPRFKFEKYISHWDCHDTEGDGEVECYFYVKEKDAIALGVGHINHYLALVLGIEPTDMIEKPYDEGHKGEYRFEYIFSLKSESPSCS